MSTQNYRDVNSACKYCAVRGRLFKIKQELILVVMAVCVLYGEVANQYLGRCHLGSPAITSVSESLRLANKCRYRRDFRDVPETNVCLLMRLVFVTKQ